MTWRTEPPFRADHVGSLLRPPALLRARADARRGRRSTPPSCGRPRTRRSARPCACRRRSACRLATDGELRRGSWHMDFIYQLGGAQQAGLGPGGRVPQPGGSVVFTPPALRVAAPVRLEHTIFGDDFAFLPRRRDDRGAEADDPVAEHGALPRRPLGHRRDGVPRPRRVLGRPHGGLPRGGRPAWASSAARYLQLDDTSLAYLNDPAQREHVREIGGDPDHQHEFYIRHLNEAIASRPEGMRITTHMCRGNFRSSWFASGGYEYVAEVLLNELEVDGFFMEYDDERSGGFEPLRFLPPGKLVVLGLVTTKSGELESQGRAQAPHRGGREVRATSISSASRRSAASPRPSTATT